MNLPQTGNGIVDRALSAIAEAWRVVEGGLFYRFRVMRSQAVATTDTVIYHALGYTPAVVIIAYQDADARIWHPSPPTAQTITLRASAAVNVTLVVA